MARKVNNRIIVQKKQQKKAAVKRKSIRKQKIISDQDGQNQQQSLSENNQKQSSLNQDDSDQKSQGNSDSNQGSDQNSQQDDDQEYQSSSSIQPQNFAIKQMQFRQRRGTKMNYLMNRKKQQEEDDFWKNQGQSYFGDMEDQENDQQYQQSSSGRDQFDSDFDQTQSEHNDQEQIQQRPGDYIDQQKQKEKKRQQELMRKIGAPTRKVARKVLAHSKIINIQNQKQNLQNQNNEGNNRNNIKLQQQSKKVIEQNNNQKVVSPIKNTNKQQVEATNKYIHQAFTQQQLLGQAAQTQYINWLSLQKLISLQSQKKDFSKKKHYLNGDKVIYRSKINQQGKNQTSYELVGVQVNKIKDLTFFMSDLDQNERKFQQEQRAEQKL